MPKNRTGRSETRREFFAATGLLATAGVAAVTPRRSLAQTQLSPDAALKELMAGNQRYTTDRLTHHEQDLSILRQHTAEKQEPFAAVLSCADSRVPVEIIFDQSIGHLFVVRVAGNIVTPEIVATVEYGAAVLGVKAALVLGHSNCGAVKAAMEGKEAPGQISALFQHIQPALGRSGGSVEAAIKANAELQSDLLQKASTVISRLVRENQFKVAAGLYEIADGSVTLLRSSGG
jgi:carbonic anhydrase